MIKGAYNTKRPALQALVQTLLRLPRVSGVQVGGQKKNPLTVYYSIKPENMPTTLFLIGRALSRNYGGQTWVNTTECTDMPDDRKVTFCLSTEGGGLLGPPAIGQEEVEAAAERLINQLEDLLHPESRHIWRHFGLTELLTP